MLLSPEKRRKLGENERFWLAKSLLLTAACLLSLTGVAGIAAVLAEWCKWLPWMKNPPGQWVENFPLAIVSAEIATGTHLA